MPVEPVTESRGSPYFRRWGFVYCHATSGGRIPLSRSIWAAGTTAMLDHPWWYDCVLQSRHGLPVSHDDACRLPLPGLYFPVTSLNAFTRLFR
jgi:hypothetical protein